jgi:hypothetical protein
MSDAVIRTIRRLPPRGPRGPGQWSRGPGQGEHKDSSNRCTALGRLKNASKKDRINEVKLVTRYEWRCNGFAGGARETWWVC